MVEALVLGLAKGKPFSKERESPTSKISSIFITSIAAIPAQLERGSRLIFPAASLDIFVMEILPGWMDDGEGDEVFETVNGAVEEVEAGAKVSHSGRNEGFVGGEYGFGFKFGYVGGSGIRNRQVVAAGAA